MVASKSIQIRFTPKTYRLIEKLKQKLGIHTTAGLVKHAIARLAEIEGITVK